MSVNDFGTDSEIKEQLAKYEEQDKGSQENAQESVPQVEEKPDQPLFEINYKGQKKQVTSSFLVDNYQKGLDYETKMSELKKERESLNQLRSQWDEKRFKELEEIDSFYRNNPDQWEAIREAYNNRGVPQEPEAAVGDLTNRLRVLEEGYKSIQEERRQRDMESLERQLVGGFAQAKKDYEFLPWDQLDANGLSMEDKVMKYMADNNLDDVDTAVFKIFRNDILNYQRDSGRRAAVEEVKKNNKLGIVGISSTPSSPPKGKTVNIRGKSMDEIVNEAIKIGYGS